MRHRGLIACGFVAALLATGPLGGSVSAAASDSVAVAPYKLAPPAEELDHRARSWLRQKKWAAAILFGGTLAGGVISMVSRRRARRRREEDPR